MKFRFAILAGIVFAAYPLFHAASAQTSRLDVVKSRGVLRCGVNPNFVGFALPPASGRPFILGLLTPATVVIGFAMPHLLRLGSTPPLRVAPHSPRPHSRPSRKSCEKNPAAPARPAAAIEGLCRS